jgi:hypothetical protein
MSKLRYDIHSGVTKAKTRITMGVAALAVAFGGGMSLALVSSASALTTNGCTFDDSVVGVWSLTADCTSTDEINIPANTTVEGNGHTISPFFSKGDSDHNSVIGIISSDNVTINDLTIDGSGGFNLHGVNVFESNNVNVNNSTLLNNDHTGLVVNGSTVTVDTITTAGNGWHGINVDQGSGVTASAVLTVNGNSTQTDALQIYVDDISKDVTVNDTLSQYSVTYDFLQPGDALYTLKGSPTSKDDCKQGGWQNLTDSNGNSFKNQGDCVSFVATKGKNKANG